MKRLALWALLLFVSVTMIRPVRAQGDAEEAQSEPPSEWIDAKTGHRVVRLSREPGSSSLYFHQYPFSADGKKMVFTRRDGIWTVNLETLENEHVVEGRVGILTTGRKTGDVYYVRRPDRGGRRRGGGDRDAAGPRGRDEGPATDNNTDQTRGGSADASASRDDDEFRPQGDIRPRRGRFRGFGRAAMGGDVFAANLDTHEERHVASLSSEFRTGNIAINADETMLVVIGTDPDAEKQPRIPPNRQIEGRLIPNWASGDARVLYTVDIATGDVNVIHHSNDWLNHLQCSPSDPGQILFCHEGPWHYVDRTWLIRTDGTGLTQIHPRTMDMEIEGHEFFGNDGKWVWYDLQTPRSLVFWLAGYEIDSGRRIWYHHDRHEWSVHYNVSPDGKLFAGDGGGPASVANLTPSHETLDPPGNGQWIYLFRPKLITMTGLAEKAKDQVKVGVFESERLVDLSQHDYSLEPNVIFTPDGKWIVFRSNMHGPTHVYAVEIAQAE